MVREPKFTRKDVANILNISTLTIANREKSGKYPAPKRDLNNYRIYSLKEVVDLQLITYKSIDFRPIVSILYDKGFRDNKQVAQILDNVETSRLGTGK